jgi:hypothetical protein
MDSGSRWLRRWWPRRCRRNEIRAAYHFEDHPITPKARLTPMEHAP